MLRSRGISQTLLFITVKWVDQGVVYHIRLSGVLQLSGLPLEPRCPDNQSFTVALYKLQYIIFIRLF